MIKNLLDRLKKPNRMGEITISVVIPIYNAMPWLDDCIESLKQQKQSGLEFIFIDDCGRDNSMDTVQKWATEDDRVQIVQNDINLGPGPSRNRGIKIARGEYLSFIDSDDYISHDFYSLLYAKATKDGARHAIAKGQAITEHQDSGNMTVSVLNDEIERGIKNGAPLWTCFRYSHWSAIYRHDLFQSGFVRYAPSRVSEDTIFLLRVGSITNDIVIENDAKYYYVQRPQSAVHTYDIDRFNNILIGLQGKQEALAPQGNSEHVRKYFDTHLPWLFNEISKCIEAEATSPQKVQNLSDKLDAVLKTLPHYEQHLEKTPEYSLLIKHGIRIPMLYYKQADQALRNAAWKEVLEKHPELAPEYGWILSKTSQ